MEQISIFEYFNDPRGRIYKITKPIRLIEAFGGIGSQAMALRDLGADFETWKLFEYDKYPIDSYNAIHGTNYKPTDIRNVLVAILGQLIEGKEDVYKKGEL